MKWERGLWALAIVAFLVGSVGLYDRIANGMTGQNVGSYITWGLQVATYIYLIGLSAGAFLLSTLVYVFNVKQLEKTGKLALFTALALLVAAMFAI
ncbi:MAG: polysulfide reductase NrfD, partial [Chloroflexi bacterium]|nr:polysulfide reductase NrfD [Chloroflexota bacterium]